MIRIAYNNKNFKRKMDNLIKYSLGYVDGIEGGKTAFFASLGPKVAEIASQYIDSNSRLNPETLHHIYEWYKVGSPDSRLFDIKYTISNLGLSFNATFKQSTSIKNGSRVPFYDKARIMESGVSVTIEPRQSRVLAFDIDGQEIFTSNPVTVQNPGGNTQKQFEKVFDSFFKFYFSQAFLRNSGLKQYFNRPVLYKKNLRQGMAVGRSAGFKTGYRWVANAGVAI